MKKNTVLWTDLINVLLFKNFPRGEKRRLVFIKNTNFRKFIGRSNRAPVNKLPLFSSVGNPRLYSCTSFTKVGSPYFFLKNQTRSNLPLLMSSSGYYNLRCPSSFTKDTRLIVSSLSTRFDVNEPCFIFTVNFFKKANKTFNEKWGSILSYFYKNNYSYLYTKHRLSFILTSLGLFIPTKFMYKVAFKPKTYILKKQMYSFLKRNEYKMHIFRNKKRLVLSRLLFKIKSQLFFRKKLFISNKIFFNFLKMIPRY
jgi:hypothetical protein